MQKFGLEMGGVEGKGGGGHKKSLLEGTLIFNRGLEIFKKGVLDKKGVMKK